ncbi:hypothetical protein JCM8208_007381 [Rhodotorula glutinis]
MRRPVAQSASSSGASSTSSSLRKELPAEADAAWTSLDLLKLTVAIVGAQLSWTVQTSYGTPYLQELGVSKMGTSLVWFAGPLGGLIVQPIVGALSDSSPSRYRRRQFILAATAIMLLATAVIAFATALAPGLVVAFVGRDARFDDRVKTVSLATAIVGVYALVAAYNALQASIRALVLDLAPAREQSSADAFLARNVNLANVCAYLAGALDLDEARPLRWIGAGQFRKLAVLSCVALTVTVAVTCFTQHEHERPELRSSAGAWSKILSVARNTAASIRTLPKPVKRVCFVQFAQWTAAFPFMFYATTYVAEAVSAAVPPGSPPPSADTATRAGSFALLLYALVALAAGIFFPHLPTLATTFPALPRHAGHVGRRVLCALSMRNLWTLSLAWYALCMSATFCFGSVRATTWIVALAGLSWAVTCWVPYALVGEAIFEAEAKNAFDDMHAAADSAALRASLLSADVPGRAAVAADEAGGTILGVHNLAIVLPQFVVAALAAVIFRLSASATSAADERDNGTVWVLRLGGLASAVGAVVTRWLDEPQSERLYRARLSRIGTGQRDDVVDEHAIAVGARGG